MFSTIIPIVSLIPFVLSLPSGSLPDVMGLRKFTSRAHHDFDEVIDKRVPPLPLHNPGGVSYVAFQNPIAQAAAVNTSALPEMGTLSPPLQTSYSGRFSVDPTGKDLNRELFYWLFPSTVPGGMNNKLVIWLNGGPGCSSMTGLFLEVGPFHILPGNPGPNLNPYAWTKVADVLFIDQPVGVGLTQGVTGLITDETQLAEQFYGFLTNFFNVYSELKGRQLYVVGESYAAYYIPNIARRILDASAAEKAIVPQLHGIAISDGTWNDWMIQEEIPMYRFAVKNAKIFGFNQTVLNVLKSVSESCGFEDTYNYLTYPPKGPIPLPLNGDPKIWEPECDLWNMVYGLERILDPAFWYYHVSPTPINTTDTITPYMSRSDVQAMLHVPNFGNWELCLEPNFWNVFTDDADNSPYPYTLLPSILEEIPVLIWHGLQDMLYLADGDRIMIQNMTWGGAQGFSTAPNKPIVVGGQVAANYGSERGLTYIEVQNSGHFVPADQPAVAWQVINFVLGNSLLGSAPPPLP